MIPSRPGIDLRSSLLYALLGGAWILFSDRLLLSMSRDPVAFARVHSWEGWVFVLGSALFIFALLRVELIRRHRTETALYAREERFRHIAERISDVVSVWDERSRITYVSPSVTRVLGYEPQEILAWRNPSAFIHAESQPDFKALRERILTGAVSDIERLEIRFKRKDGTWAWLDLEATPFQADKRFGGLQVIARDVTERKLAEDALRQSARSYRGIFNAATDAIFVHDAATGTILDVNDAALRLFEVDRAEALNLTPDAANLGVSPYSAVEARQWMARAIAEGPQLFEWLARKKSGELFWVETALKCAELDGQQRVLALVRDISERKRTAEVLQEKHEELERFFGLTLDLMCIADMDGHLLRVNHSWKLMLGHDLQQMQGRKFLEFIHPDDVQPTLQAIAALSAGRDVVDFSNRYRGQDGSYRWIEWRATPYQGRLIYAVARDITERKRAEHQLILQRDLGLALGNSRDLAETVRLCAEAGIATSGLECGGVYLVNRATGLFELAYHHGCSEAFARTARHYEPDANQARLFREGQAFYANFRELPPPAAASGLREGLKALAICPIRQHNQVIGSLNLASHVHESVPEFSRAALEAIAGQVSQAIARDQTLAALQASERSYREIFNGADDAIYVHDSVTGAIIDANASMRIMFGFGDGDISGLNLDEVSLGTSPYSAVEGEQWLVKAATEGPQRFEWLSRKKSGELFWVEVSLKSAQIAGQPRLLALVRDITQRKQTEEALARERLFTNAVLDSVPGLLYLYDEKGRLVRWNRRHEEMTGYSGEELRDRYLLDWFEGEDRAQVARGILRGGHDRHTSVEANLKTKDGRQVPFLFTAVPLVIDGRQYVTGIGLDISERRRTDEELRQLRQELAHVGRTLTLGELGSSIAHELNQPLTTILSNAQAARNFLDRDPVDLGEVRHALADIERADRHAGEVIQRLRNYIGRKEAPHELVDLSQAIRDVLRLVRAEAASRDIMTIAHLALNLPLVCGDRVALQQVLLNLIVNAFDAVRQVPPSERQVTVRSQREEGDTVAVTVSDTGPVLAPHVQEMLFEPFFTTKPDGLGLGLSLSRSLVEAHGGQAWAAPHPEGGMTFGFRLPIARKNPA